MQIFWLSKSHLSVYTAKLERFFYVVEKINWLILVTMRCIFFFSSERAQRSRQHDRGTSAEKRYKRSHRRSPTSNRRHRHRHHDRSSSRGRRHRDEHCRRSYSSAQVRIHYRHIPILYTHLFHPSLHPSYPYQCLTIASISSLK